MRRPSRFLDRAVDIDERRCRVCGHVTVTPLRRSLNGLLLIVIGALLAYTVLDIAHGGRLDGSLLRAIEQTWTVPAR